MSNPYYRIVSRFGVTLGWTHYQNTSDVWTGATADTLDDLRAPASEPHGEVRWCRCHRWHRNAAVVAYALPVSLGDDNLPGYYCEVCAAFITPPFDGWRHHEYGCECGGCSWPDSRREVARSDVAEQVALWPRGEAAALEAAHDGPNPSSAAVRPVLDVLRERGPCSLPQLWRACGGSTVVAAELLRLEAEGLAVCEWEEDAPPLANINRWRTT